MTEEIKLLEDGKVRVQYVDKELDIKNKKQNTVGIRDITYTATYNNKLIAANLFREKSQEHKTAIKNIDKGLEESRKEIASIHDMININTMTKTRIESMIVKTDKIIEDIQNLE